MTTTSLPVIGQYVDIIDCETTHAVRSGTVVGHGTMHRPPESGEDFFDIPARVEPIVLVKLVAGIASPENSARPDLFIDTLPVHPDNLRIVR
jgi:hypothetical protein